MVLFILGLLIGFLLGIHYICSKFHTTDENTFQILLDKWKQSVKEDK